MKKYIYISPDTNVVGSILDEVDMAFPGIPIEKRYSRDFLSACLIMDEAEFNEKSIYSGMVYDKETGEFSPPPAPIDPVLPSPEENPDQPINPDAGEEHKTYAEKLAALEEENKQLTAKLDASIQSNQMLEDCLVEMAEIVYA